VSKKKTERRIKCEIRDGKFVVPCDTLNNCTEFGNPRGKQKGIWWYRWFNVKTDEPTISFFGAKSGDHVEKGMIFHFCPFCGTRIDEPITNRDKLAEKTEGE